MKKCQTVGKKHQQLLLLLTFPGRLGFYLGYIVDVLFLLLLAILQSFYAQNFIVAVSVAITIILVFAIVKALKYLPFVIWVSRVWVGVIFSMAIVYAPFIQSLLQFLFAHYITFVLLGIVVAIVMALSSVVIAYLLGKYRLSPRLPFSHYIIGIIVGSTLLTASISFSVVSRFNYFKHSEVLILIAVALIGTLFLRIHASHFTDPESLGFALFFARFSEINPQRIIKFYRYNWIAIILPLIIGTTTLLLFLQATTAVLLLFSLTVFEMSVEEFAIHRRTLILPISKMKDLGFLSVSGVGAGINLVIVFSSLGITGFTGTINLDSQSFQVVCASALFIVASIILFLLRYAEINEWLPSIYYTEELKND